MSGLNDGTHRIKGAEDTITIPRGEWYINTKGRARWMISNSLSSDACRIYACLELATMGFSQELAVTMENGKQRPLSPGDIARQTGLRKQNVTRGLVELESAGLAVRRGIDGGPLYKGRTQIFSWASPKPGRQVDGNRARLPFPDWVPASWELLRPLISRLRLKLQPDFVPSGDYLSRVESAARDFQESGEVIVALLKEACAQRPSSAPSLYERNGKETTERNSSSSPVASVAVKADEEEFPPTYATFKRLYPSGRFDEPKARPAFERLTGAQRRRCIQRLHIYLQCERWKDCDGQWIPFASTWLKVYEADPPPAFRVAGSSSDAQKEQIEQTAQAARYLREGVPR